MRKREKGIKLVEMQQLNATKELTQDRVINAKVGAEMHVKVAVTKVHEKSCIISGLHRQLCVNAQKQGVVGRKEAFE